METGTPVKSVHFTNICHTHESVEEDVKGGFFQKVQCVFQISKSPKRNIPKNYPELEI